MAIQFTDENFKKEALESELPVLVDFYADWCGPCKMMAPIVTELAEDYKNIFKIGKLNVDEESQTAGQYRVMSIPTMLILKGGAVVDTIVGAVSKNALQAKLESYK